MVSVGFQTVLGRMLQWSVLVFRLSWGECCSGQCWFSDCLGENAAVVSVGFQTVFWRMLQWSVLVFRLSWGECCSGQTVVKTFSPDRCPQRTTSTLTKPETERTTTQIIFIYQRTARRELRKCSTIRIST